MLIGLDFLGFMSGLDVVDGSLFFQDCGAKPVIGEHGIMRHPPVYRILKFHPGF